MPETIIERKPRPRDQVVIRLSGGRLFAVPEAAAQPFAVGQSLSDDDIAHLDGVAQYTRGREKAMRMLALRARSKREIDDALRALGIRDTIRTGIVRGHETQQTGNLDRPPRLSFVHVWNSADACRRVGLSLELPLHRRELCWLGAIDELRQQVAAHRLRQGSDCANDHTNLDRRAMQLVAPPP